MIFSKLLLINTLQRLEAQTLGHYWLGITIQFRRSLSRRLRIEPPIHSKFTL